MYSEEFESYFRLLWLLVLFVSILITFLCYLYLAMRKARQKESESMASFSLVLEGQEAERQRVAAELHDTVLPNLKDNAVAARVREICGHLMPPDFNRFNLKDSLVSLCDSFVKQTGIKCIVEIAEDLDWTFLGAEQQLNLYRIVQEALNNVGKHSRATQSMLVVRKGGTDLSSSPKPFQSILLSVSDDGVGLKNLRGSAGDDGGFGMRIMRQRAALLGAHIDFISEEGNGCMVCVEIKRSEEK
jgi:two-component system NarL family sensor kinase